MSSKKTDIINSRKVISIETKKEIIRKFEDGVKQKDLASEYGLHKNTVQTILSKKDKIKKANVAKGVSRLTPRRKPLGDQMENLLLLWLEEHQVKGIPTNQNLIRKKAMLIYQDLKNKYLKDQSHAENEDFMASRGWFSKFCKRAGLFKIMLHDEVSPGQINFQSLILGDSEQPGYNQPLIKIKEAEEQGGNHIKDKNTALDAVEEGVLLDHQKPFIFEELQPLAQIAEEEARAVQRHILVPQVIKNLMPINSAKELLQKWEEVWNFVCQWHPKQEEVIQVGNAFEKIAMAHFRLLLQDKEGQGGLDCQPIQNSIKQEKFVRRFNNKWPQKTFP